MSAVSDRSERNRGGPDALDPRLGVLWISVTCIAIWMAGAQSLSALAASLLIAMLIHRESPARLMASARGILIIAAMAVLFNAFTWVEGLGPAVNPAGFRRGLVLASRFLLSVFAARFLVVLQGETGVARGISWWLRPFGPVAEERGLGFILLVLRGMRDLRRANRLRSDALRVRAGVKPGFRLRAWSWQGLLRRHLVRTVASADALSLRLPAEDRRPFWPPIRARDPLVMLLWTGILALCLLLPRWV